MPPNTPKIGNGLVLLIRVGKYIWLEALFKKFQEISHLLRIPGFETRKCFITWLCKPTLSIDSGPFPHLTCALPDQHILMYYLINRLSHINPHQYPPMHCSINRCMHYLIFRLENYLFNTLMHYLIYRLSWI